MRGISRECRGAKQCLNLEIGRKSSCDMASYVATASALKVQVCINDKLNCLKEISVGTVPYALSSTYSSYAENASKAEEAAQCHYAHRVTADLDMLDSKELGKGYFDFHTPTLEAVTDGLYDGYSVPAGSENGGFIQWTPINGDGNILHMCSKADGSGNVVPLEELVFHAQHTQVNGDMTIGRGTTDKLVINSNVDFNGIVYLDWTNAEPGPDSRIAGGCDENGEPTGWIAENTISGCNIQNRTITAEDIAIDTITATNIAENSIGMAELADGAVNTNHIVDGTITGADIKNGSVTHYEIGTGAVRNDELATDAVTSEKIDDYSISGKDINFCDSTNEKNGNCIHGFSHIANGSISGLDLA